MVLETRDIKTYHELNEHLQRCSICRVDKLKEGRWEIVFHSKITGEEYSLELPEVLDFQTPVLLELLDLITGFTNKERKAIQKILKGIFSPEGQKAIQDQMLAELCTK
jgi:hypothetical protein